MSILKVYNLLDKYFADKVDKGGHPYSEHLFTVGGHAKKLAEKYLGNSWEEWDVYEVGLLHDILEDTACTEQELIEVGCNDDIIEAVKSITRKPEEKYYFDFIKRVSKNKYARIVKIADLENNMDITRLNKFGDYEMKRLKKYWYSWKYLKGELTEEQVRKEIGDIK